MRFYKFLSKHPSGNQFLSKSVPKTEKISYFWGAVSKFRKDEWNYETQWNSGWLKTTLSMILRTFLIFSVLWVLWFLLNSVMSQKSVIIGLSVPNFIFLMKFPWWFWNLFPQKMTNSTSSSVSQHPLLDFLKLYIFEIIILCCTKQCLRFLKLFTDALQLPFKGLIEFRWWFCRTTSLKFHTYWLTFSIYVWKMFVF